MDQSPAQRSRLGILPALGLALISLLVLTPAARAAGGDLDPSFGEGGKVLVDAGGRSLIDVAVDERGRTVGLIAFQGAVARFLPGGELDPSFGTGGIVEFELGGDERYARALTIDERGRILLAASDGYFGDEDAGAVLRVVRLLPDGSLDPSFGEDGTQTVDPIRGRYGLLPTGGIAVDREGGIIVGGETSPYYEDAVPAVVRLHDDGGLDRSFRRNGVWKLDRDLQLATYAYQTEDLALGRNGGIAIVGQGAKCLGGPSYQPCKRFKRGSIVIRLTPNGRLQRSFSRDGIQRAFNLKGLATTVAIDGRGRTVLGGKQHGRNDSDLIVARLSRKGHNDRHFNRGRPRLLDLGGSEEATDLTVGAGGIYVAGTAEADGPSDFALGKLKRNGKPARQFGSHGGVLTDFGRADTANALALAPTGEVVLVGRSGNRYEPSLALARYLP